MNYSRPGDYVSSSPATRHGRDAASRKFVSPDSPVTGRSVVVSDSPAIPMVPLVPAQRRPVQAGPNPRCLAELLNMYKGRTVGITIVPSMKGESVEKTGVLFFAGPGHIALRETNGKNIVICDINLIKIVNIYDAF